MPIIFPRNNGGSSEPDPIVSPPAGLPGQILEGISLAGANAVGGQSAILANLQLANLVQNTNQSHQNAVSFQQTLNSLQITILGKVVNMLTTVGPIQSEAVIHTLTGNAVADTLGAVKAATK